MNKEIKFYHLWETRNVVISVGVSFLIFALLGLYFYYPQISDYYRLSKYDSQTTGYLIRCKEIPVIKNTKIGNKVKIDHFDVEFTYKVDGIIYKNTTTLPGQEIIGYKLEKILNSTNKNIKVKFYSDQPSKSEVNLKEE